MTGERSLPSLGLQNRWTPGTNGWGPGMDRDLALLDTILQLGVKSLDVSDPPANPAVGDRYIVGDSPTGVWAGKKNQVVLFLDGAWTFFVPNPGWQSSVLDRDFVAYFDGVVWRPRTEPYDIQVWRDHMPGNILIPLLSLLMPRKVTFPAGFAVSMASCISPPGVNPTVFNVCRNGATVGTLSFPVNSLGGTFALAADTVWTRGDTFDVFLASAADPAFSGLRIAFAGNR